MADPSYTSRFARQPGPAAANHASAKGVQLPGVEPLQRKAQDPLPSSDPFETDRKEMPGRFMPFGKQAPAEFPEMTVKEKVAMIRSLVLKAIDASADTRELDLALQQIKKKYNLQQAGLIRLGTPEAAAFFKVNPLEEITLPTGKLIYRMTGTAMPPQTLVHHDVTTITVGTQSSTVGTHMVADRLAPDHEPGSTSSNDKAQGPLMQELANAGNTAVPNDQKYIKGHLLNDHLGGQGQAYNLFPITGDANAKHLVYVEKFIKAQLDKSYIIYYEVKVTHGTPVALSTGGKYSLDADFNFSWHLLDATGALFGAVHQNLIESRYNALGTPPFDVNTEYKNEYTTLNLGKSTPIAIGHPSQWQQTGVTAPGMSYLGPTPITMPSYTFPTGNFGGGGSSSSTGPKHDFSANAVKTDAKSGLEFISLRNTDAAAVAIGDTMQVKDIANPGKFIQITVNSISPLSGGWTRIYF